MAVEFRILGPLEAVRDGVAVQLGGRRERALLAILLVHAGEAVSTDRIFDELYGERPPPTAASSLQNAVSKLRKVLGAGAILTRTPGYALGVGPGAVDAGRFESLVADAPTDSAERAEVLRDALNLWRGDPLSDFAFEPFAQAEIARLQELRLLALEERIDAELALANHAAVVGELNALVAEHPYRERLRGQLMTALYGAGRQADALEAYQRSRATFAEELGIEPSPALKELERAILQQDPALTVPRAQAPARTEAAAPRPVERRQVVTVLFVDVVHSTRLARSLDPEALREVMSRYFAVVRRVLEHHGGTVEKFIGDAAFAVFGVPRIHEDDALRAIRAASAVREAVAELNAELLSEWGVEITLRTGINTGEVVAGGAHELLASGHAVNLAKRLEEAAGANEILVGETTWRLVREAVEAEPLELPEARDVERAWRIEGVADVPPFARRLETPLVGRERELTRLRQAFDQALADARAQLVTVLGPAGIGKTRLALELAARLSGALVLTGRCPPFGEALTYWPLREIAEQAGEPGVALLEELERGSAEEIMLAARSLCERVAQERPLVLVLEDIHWAEPTLLDLVEYLVDRLHASPALVLCLARLELLEGRTSWAGGLVNSATLLLEPLSAEEAQRLVGTLLGSAAIDNEARARVVETADGNPLFVEQLLSAVLMGEARELPPTIEALLAARLDRLGPAERALLEVAAIAGREFTLAGAAELLPSEAVGSVDRHVASLVRRELVRPTRSAGADDSFAFRHVLVRDAAYRSTPKARRADLHRRYAGRLERLAAEDELVGFHLEQAHRYLTDLRRADDRARHLAERAGDRLARAGIRSWKRADVPAAVNLLTRGTALLGDGERRRELLCELGLAHQAGGELERGKEILQRVLDASVASGDRRLEHRARIELVAATLFSEPTARANELVQAVDDAIPVFTVAGDDRSLGRALLVGGRAKGALLCQNEEWREASERARVHYERAGWPPSSAIGAVAAAMYHGPTPVATALERCEALLEGPAMDGFARAGVIAIAALLRALQGRSDEARALLAESAVRYDELGHRAGAAADLGWARAELEFIVGDAPAAEQVLQPLCRQLADMGATESLSTKAAELAEAVYLQGRLAEALEWTRVSEANAAVDDLSAQFSWRGVRAKVLAHEEDGAAAEDLAREGVAVVERTDCLNQHAKTLLDLVVVLRVTGRSEETPEVIRRALALYERKGNAVGAKRARSLLADEPSASAPTGPRG